MSNKKIVHYSLDEIDSRGADFNIIYGERSNGKSYQVKHKKAIVKYLETGRRFILMRRLREEISPSNIEQYFQDVDFDKLTNGKYNCISMYRKQLFLSNYDIETNKTKRGELVGYVVALSTEQNYAGASYLDVDDIIFEEFMSRSGYLHNEPDKLMNFYCTVDRKRKTTRIWLVGNTITRVNPYIDEWGLSNIVFHQKQETIEESVVESGDDDSVKIAIEYCKPTGSSSHTIGKHKKMLNSGEWQSDPQPHLPKSLKDYNTLYIIGFEYQNFKFLAKYLEDKESKNCCWFVFPYKKDFKDDLLVFSDKIKNTIYYQRDIYNPLIYNDTIKAILNTFRESNIFYATDLDGTDFKQCIDFIIKK